MTHEEATERIKCILKNNSFTRADKNALKLAIEALEYIEGCDTLKGE